MQPENPISIGLVIIILISAAVIIGPILWKRRKRFESLEPESIQEFEKEKDQQ